MIFTIAGKDLKSLFTSPVAWVVLTFVQIVVGYGFLNELLPYDNHVLLVSGRASFEIMQKALAARIAIVAAISAPSSLAAEFAQSSGQTLIGFLRAGRMNIYAHPERIRN